MGGVNSLVCGIEVLHPQLLSNTPTKTWKIHHQCRSLPDGQQPWISIIPQIASAKVSAIRVLTSLCRRSWSPKIFPVKPLKPPSLPALSPFMIATFCACCPVSQPCPSWSRLCCRCRLVSQYRLPSWSPLSAAAAAFFSSFVSLRDRRLRCGLVSQPCLPNCCLRCRCRLLSPASSPSPALSPGGVIAAFATAAALSPNLVFLHDRRRHCRCCIIFQVCFSAWSPPSLPLPPCFPFSFPCSPNLVCKLEDWLENIFAIWGLCRGNFCKFTERY